MAPGRKAGDGCWTCRLRRKRCDLIRPVCGSCNDLSISCYVGKAKPLWMDGATRQKQMTDKIKKEIKQGAAIRREKQMLQAHWIRIVDFEPEPSPEANPRTPVSAKAGPGSTSQYSLNADTLSTLSLASEAKNDASPAVFVLPSYSPDASASPIRMELSSVMIYLDHCFPFLFPFYQPSLLETGRQWLLGLLCQNEVFFHIAGSMSAYFFSLATENDEMGIADECKALIKNKLLEQMNMAIIAMQSALSIINRSPRCNTMLSLVRVMQDITQLLIVETMVRRSSDWEIHLNPAMTLFEDIFLNYGMEDSEPSLSVLLRALPLNIPGGTPHNKPLPNTADQAALVFFISVLTFIDVVSSASLGQAPKLKAYHNTLLSSGTGDRDRLQLATTIGCENWAMLAIGDISTLYAWKREELQKQTYTTGAHIDLAAPILHSIHNGLINLDITSNTIDTQHSSLGRLESYYTRAGEDVKRANVIRATRIWAHAARIYLLMGIQNQRQGYLQLETDIEQILCLLSAIDSPAQLRSLSWPMVVAGCLASVAQEHRFRHLYTTMGHLQEFGMFHTAMKIMEAAWAKRGTAANDDLDIHLVLNILGTTPLLF